MMPSARVYYRGLINTYLTAASISALGLSDFSVRLPNAIIGALIVPILFVFGRAVGGTAAGLGAAAFGAAQPELITLSASAWMTPLFVVVFVGAAYLLYLGFERDHPTMQLVGAAAAVLAVLGHELGAHLAFAVVLTIVVRTAARDRRWFAGTRTAVALGILGTSVLLFIALGLLLRAATISGPGGEFRQYFGPSLMPDRFLMDYERWRYGYPVLLAGAVVGIPLLLRARLKGALFIYSALAVTSFTVWVIIAKESDRYGLVLLPLLALAAAWGFWEAVRLLGAWLRLNAVSIRRIRAAVMIVVFGISFQRDARAAISEIGLTPRETWLTEFRALGPAPNDLIVSDTPEMCAVYLGTVHYWDRADDFERYGYLSAGSIRHLYTGALKIGTPEEFMQVVRSGQAGTLWYIGHGMLLSSDAVVAAAELVHQTQGEETILKFRLGGGH